MPRTRQSILSATLLRPERAWYAADLARHLHVPRSSLQRELAALVRAGILRSHRQGHMVYVQADTGCPVFPELRGLLSKTAGLADVLRASLAALDDRISCCFVFGSVARGEENSGSDVDLMLIGTIGLADLSLPLREAQDELGRDVNPKLYHPEEFAKRLAARDHFLTSVLQKPRIFVIGTERDLDQIAERQPRDGRAVE